MERNSKIHNGILLLAPAYHMNVYINVQMNVHRNVYTNIHKDTSLAATGALAHRLQRLQNPKWPPGGPKMADGVWKGVYP